MKSNDLKKKTNAMYTKSIETSLILVSFHIPIQRLYIHVYITLDLNATL